MPPTTRGTILNRDAKLYFLQGFRQYLNKKDFHQNLNSHQLSPTLINSRQLSSTLVLVCFLLMNDISLQLRFRFRDDFIPRFCRRNNLLSVLQRKVFFNQRMERLLRFHQTLSSFQTKMRIFDIALTSYFIILLSLTPDDCIHQGKSAAL